MIAGIIGITPGRIAPHAVTNSQYRESRALTPSPGVPAKSLKATESKILTVIPILRPRSTNDQTGNPNIENEISMEIQRARAISSLTVSW